MSAFFNTKELAKESHLYYNGIVILVINQLFNICQINFLGF